MNLYGGLTLESVSPCASRVGVYSAALLLPRTVMSRV